LGKAAIFYRLHPVIHPLSGFKTMFGWAILSIIQIVYLPGAIFFRLFNRKEICAPGWLIIFSTSLFANLIIVVGLTSFGIYSKMSVLLIMVIELSVYIRLVAKADKKNPVMNISISVRYKHTLDGLLRVSGILFLIILGGLAIYPIIERLLNSNPGIFDLWDDVVSWNRWAVDWAGNRLPNMTMEYPQLIPANWSLTYIFMENTDIQIFAKAITGLFPLALVGIFIDMTIRFRSASAILALIILSYLLVKISGPSIGSGYVDIPVAFFAALSFYAYFLVKEKALSFRSGALIAALMAGAASNVKQAGIFAVVILPFFLLFLNKNQAKKERQWHTILIAMTLSVVLTLPWYVYKQIQFYKGTDISNTGYVTNQIYAEKSLFKRAINSSAQIYKLFGTPNDSMERRIVSHIVGLAIVGGAMLSIFTPYNLVLWAIILPYYLIWSIWFCYDMRNLTLVLLPLAFCSAVGLSNMISRIYHLSSIADKNSYLIKSLTVNLPVARIKLAVIGAVASVMLAGFTGYMDKQLLELNRFLQYNVGDLEVNRRILDFYDSNQLNGKVISTYIPFFIIPELKDTVFSNDWRIGQQNPDEARMVEKLSNSHPICGLIEATSLQNHIKYLFIQDGNLNRDKISNSLNSGQMKQHFKIKGYSFYELFCSDNEPLPQNSGTKYETTHSYQSG